VRDSEPRSIDSGDRPSVERIGVCALSRPNDRAI